ncbi:MAG: peptidoglycan DD-metalloendopeptidase family protein [Desulfovibrionales bacterium]|nr:peptidoglycan DD-metalloendopeptidase family protein [Desulfovibrionales bacterium]
MVAPVDSDLLTSTVNSQQLKAKTRQLKGLDSGSAADSAKLREAVEGFEAIFIQKMWQQMRKSVPKSGMFKSRDEKMWQSMYDQELSIKMSRSGGVGLSDMLYRQLSETLGEASRTTTTQGATALPVRALSDADRTVAVDAKTVATSPAEEADDLYTPLDEAGVTEEVETAITVPLQRVAVKTDTEFMTDAEVVENVQALGQKIVSGSRNEEGIRASQPVKAEMVEAVTRQRAVKQQTVVSSAASTQAVETTLGVGGPLEPTPDMATINWPLPGPISSKFGWRKDPFTGKQAWHSGVDIAGKVGEPVAAAWDGKVIFSGERSGYGNLVVVEHPNGWRSYYGHNSKVAVEVGDDVTAGKKIAEVGSTGRSTGPHLHFEIRQGELAWNPQQIRSRLMAGLPIGKMG